MIPPKHTPGKWKTMETISGKMFVNSYEIEPDGDPVPIAEIKNQEEKEANARLIAAAPDLLKACWAVLSVLPLYIDSKNPASPYKDGSNPFYVWESKEALEKMLDAMEKAEGARPFLKQEWK